MDPVVVACVRPASGTDAVDQAFSSVLDDDLAAFGSETKTFYRIFDGKHSQSRLFGEVVQPKLAGEPLPVFDR